MTDFFFNNQLSIFKIVVSVAVTYVVMSFGEHAVHQKMMHKKVLPSWVYKKWDYMGEVYDAHAVRHHGVWYRDFDYESNPAGRTENIELRLVETLWLLVLMSPIIALLFAALPVAAVVFVAMMFIHSRLWNILHTEMHMPENKFFAKWAIFRWLACHHYMHHRATNKNFNIVFPLADYLMGTKKEPGIKDLRELMRLGYILPRSAQAKRKIAALQAKVNHERLVAVQSLTPEMV